MFPLHSLFRPSFIFILLTFLASLSFLLLPTSYQPTSHSPTHPQLSTFSLSFFNICLNLGHSRSSKATVLIFFFVFCKFVHHQDPSLIRLIGRWWITLKLDADLPPPLFLYLASEIAAKVICLPTRLFHCKNFSLHSTSKNDWFQISHCNSNLTKLVMEFLLFKCLTIFSFRA